MQQLLLILCLISIIIVFTDAAPQTNFKDLTKRSNQMTRKNQNTKSQQTNTKPIGMWSKRQKKEKSLRTTIKETQFQILNVLKPLFGVIKFVINDHSQEQKIKIEIKMEKQLTRVLQMTLNNTIKQIKRKAKVNRMRDSFYNGIKGWILNQIITTVSFDLVPGTIEVFYEEILKPTTIKGAFFISQYKIEDKIDFYIKSQNNTLIYSKEKVKEGIFNIDILEKGEYKFIFQNKRSKQSKTITFTLDVHDSEQEFLKMADLDPLALRVERIIMAMKDNYFFDKIAGQQFDGNLQEIQNSNNKLLLFSVIEILGVIFITIWQVFYLKRMVGNQRIF